ncbi:MAG: methylated-DNA--[protein]-cysteine S-methyltransferase [Anaerolineaceae bacterium]
MSEIRDPGLDDSELSDSERAAFGEAPSPTFLRTSRSMLRGRHARAHGLIGFFDLEIPVGMLRVVHDGILVHLITNAPEQFEERSHTSFGFEPPPLEAPALSMSLRRVFAGQENATNHAYLDSLPPFQQMVLRVTARIPRGEVRPYQWVAREAGVALAVRAAGTALGRNPLPFLVPCHRVVRSDWSLGKYSAAGGAQTKLAVLRWEGCSIERLAAAEAGRAQVIGNLCGGAFCLPVCPRVDAIAPADRRDFRHIEDALAAGLRPCRHCRPVALA